MKNIFSDSVASRILVYLFNSDNFNFEFKIAKEIDCNYSSCSKNINLLKSLNLINSVHKSQMNVITLTTEGRYIGKRLNKINKIFKEK